jgi:hypothetical protein
MTDTATRARFTARVFYPASRLAASCARRFTVRSVRRAVILASLVLAATPVTGQAQVFLASRPHPDFAIGPLFVVAQVRPELTPIPVTISWSLTVPAGQRAADIKQDLFLLWPTELVEEAEIIGLCGRPDEEQHRRGSAARRTLVYRGVRRLPSARLALGPLATVRHWDDEYHELEVELEADRVIAVQSRVRRQRVAG